MKKSVHRTPRGYDGTEVTTHHLSDVLPAVLSKVDSAYAERPELILASWPDVIGPQLRTMTQAVSFSEGVLYVKVKNSTLYSLLNQHEKPKLLRKLQEKFPKHSIKNILFRMG